MPETLDTTFPCDCRGSRPALATACGWLIRVAEEFPGHITFHTGTSFESGRQSISNPGRVIDEVKHEKGAKNTPAQPAIRLVGIQERVFHRRTGPDPSAPPLAAIH